MTSMSRVATDGSVSGSKLVTQNMLLGLDKGWMMGRGTKRETCPAGDTEMIRR